jgi:molybdopterin-biosynthesis enzyme MoeA-like protein
MCNEIHVVFKVFIFGGLGPLHSDVSLAGVAKAFGVRLVRPITFSCCKSEFSQYFSIYEL